MGGRHKAREGGCGMGERAQSPQMTALGPCESCARGGCADSSAPVKVQRARGAFGGNYPAYSPECLACAHAFALPTRGAPIHIQVPGAQGS